MDGSILTERRPGPDCEANFDGTEGNGGISTGM